MCEKAIGYLDCHWYFGKIMATAQNILWCDLDVRLIAIDSDKDVLISIKRVLKGYRNYYIPLVKKITTARTPDLGWFGVWFYSHFTVTHVLN